MSERVIINLRWGAASCADNTWYAYAGNKTVDAPFHSFIDVERLPTERAAFEELRKAICRHFRLPNDSTVVNDLGWRLTPQN